MDKIVTRLLELKEQANADTLVFRPLFFRISDKGDREKFLQLLDRPGISVTDQIYDQLRELIKTAHPSKRLSDGDIREHIESRLAGTDLLSYGVWVYYPWSARMVHVLDREEFIAVRTSRNIYKITPAERDVLAGKRIGVIGLSVGQSVSVTLAMERICGEIRLADFDVLELTNLNRIRTGIHNLGVPKVISVAREISEIDPFIDVKCFPDGLTENNMQDFFTKDGKLDLVVEESDGFDIKILCRYKARELGVPVIMEASDRCMVDVERFDLEPERPILHGIVKNLDIPTLRSLKTNEQKIPYMLEVLGFNKTTARLRASMLEMTHTISTWPQLASAVTMGGGITADVSRRMLLGHFTDSGRYYVDVEQIIGNRDDAVKKVKGVLPVRKEKTTFNVSRSLAKSEKATPLPEDSLKQIVSAACKAPSFANLQPWQWVSQGGVLVLYNAFDKYGLSGDPGRINLMLSLGASVENAVQAASSLGYEAHVELFPDKGDENLVAAFRFTQSGKKDTGGLAAYIDARQTNRARGNAKPLTDPAREELLNGNTEGDAKVRLITNRGQIETLARIGGECERLRLITENLHAEYFEMLSAMSGQESIESIQSWPPQVSLAMDVIGDPSVSRLLGRWDLGSAFSAYYEDLIGSSSAIGVISVADPTPQAAVRAGMTAERVWLTATRLNLAIHPFSLPLAFMRSDCRLPAEKKSYLKAFDQQLSLIFSGVEATNVLFLFRISEAAPNPVRSPRKGLEEIFIK